ncbi:MAG: hypothetical protein KBA71_05730 [Opitutaceae bacterium]|nr:hypothetical protein [Opitutaceae bacterium]
MFARKDLIQLERRKAILRMRIRLQRAEMAVHVREVLRPLGWIESMQARWQSLPWGVRMLSGSLGFLAQRALLRRLPWRAKALLWLPAAWKLARQAFPLMTKPAGEAFRVPSKEEAVRIVKLRRSLSGAKAS